MMTDHDRLLILEEITLAAIDDGLSHGFLRFSEGTQKKINELRTRLKEEGPNDTSGTGTPDK